MADAAADGPLAARSIGIAGTSPADDYARRLLESLGATIHRDHDDLRLASHSAAADWARSGAMALTGRSDGAPELAPGAPASALRAALGAFAYAARERAAPLAALPGVELLGERAARAGFGRRAPWSAGGAFRPLAATDGWLGLSLARASDVALLPALTERPIGDDPWESVGAWVSENSVSAVQERAILLGLPAAQLPRPVPEQRRAPVVAVAGGRATRRAGSLVVDLSSLWAGPLCAHLLGLTGSRVIKVEGRGRMDGARLGPPAFYDLLHSGHESVVVDFASRRGREALLRLVAAADVVIEATRPRALRQLGVAAEDCVATGTVWVSITAYGRDGAGAYRVGFGDDVAAGAGLVRWEADGPHPVGDAVADPLTGAVAAAAASAALGSGRGWLLDVSMHDVAVAAASSQDDDEAAVVRVADQWWLDLPDGRLPVAGPRARLAPTAAAKPGAQTQQVLAELEAGLSRSRAIRGVSQGGARRLTCHGERRKKAE